MPSSRDQIIDKIAKNSGVMIKRLNTIEIFEHIVKNRIIGLKSEQQQLSDRYIIFKCQRARVWLGIAKITTAINEISEKIDDTLTKVYYDEYLGIPLNSLKFFGVEIVMKSYVPMEQTALLQTQIKDQKLSLFDMTSINFIKEMIPLDTSTKGLKSLIGFIYDKQFHQNTKNSIVTDSSGKLY